MQAHVHKYHGDCLVLLILSILTRLSGLSDCRNAQGCGECSPSGQSATPSGCTASEYTATAEDALRQRWDL